MNNNDSWLKKYGISISGTGKKRNPSDFQNYDKTTAEHNT